MAVSVTLQWSCLLSIILHRLALTLAALTLVAGCGSPPATQSSDDVGSLRFINSVTVPNDERVDGTLVGGLSGIDYDPKPPFNAGSAATAPADVVATMTAIRDLIV